MCGKETKDYKSEPIWIHIDNTGLYYKLHHDGKDESVLIKCEKIASPTTDSVDFCCLGCLVEWLISRCADKVYVRDPYNREFLEARGNPKNYSENCRHAINFDMKTAHDVIMRKRLTICSVWWEDEDK